MSGALTARPRRETVGVLAALTLAELAALAAYLASVPVAITSSRYLLYPFVWLNVGAIAVWRVSPGPAGRRRRWLAAGAGAAYFLGLAAVSGVVAVGAGSGVTVHWALPPGWGPMVMGYVGPLRVAAAPYRIGGYLALAYLVYATLADAEASLVGGLVGVFTCVSCTLPVVAAVVSSLAGGAVAVGTASALSSDAATAVFVLAVGLLAWRPDAAVGRWLR
ncbi:hypothetical protein KVP04_11390 [Halobacterium salinarum]|uniref:DUF7546 family protein n=1 Tax=Halobacterium salinarum TaxID=2242 RepID=UPI001F27C187|nr:hypothetical protein [Halobacterium salinarum]MCF2239716.1 hypothetical protein [Halobacterium salinarum]